MKRILSIIVCFAMCLTLLGGSSIYAEDEASEQESSLQYRTTYGDKEFDNVTITVELFDRSNAPEGSTILDNKWTKYAQEQMQEVGINVEYLAVPRSDEITKMQTMIASGTAPDLTLTYTYSYADNYYKDGGIWDLSPFVDEDGQAENLKEYLGEECINIGRGHDALYGIVARRATTANSNLFIREDWLNELNLDVPETPDDLYEFVKAVKDENLAQDSNVIGAYFWGLESGSTGTSARNNMSMAFSQLADDETELLIADGIDYYYDPGYREYIRYINKFYNDGLMDPEFYASTNDLFIQQMVTEQLAFYESNVNYNVDPLRGSPETTLRTNNENAKFVSIPNLKNVNDDVRYADAYGLGGLIVMFPKTTSEDRVEAGVTYLDWLATEQGGYVIYHGFEDEHYELEEGLPIVKDAEYNADDKDWIRTDLFLVGNQGYFQTVEDFNEVTAAENPIYTEDVLNNYTNSLTGEIRHKSQFSSPTEVEIKDDILLARAEYQVQCITCEPDKFDEIYDEWMNELERIGIQEVIDERTEFYNS